MFLRLLLPISRPASKKVCSRFEFLCVRLQKSLFEILASIHIQKRKLAGKISGAPATQMDTEHLLRELNKNLQLKEGIESSFRASQQQRKTLLMVLHKLYITMQAKLEEVTNKGTETGYFESSNQGEPSAKELRVAVGMLKMKDRHQTNAQFDLKREFDNLQLPMLKTVSLEQIVVHATKCKSDVQTQTDVTKVDCSQEDRIKQKSVSRDKKSNFDHYVSGILIESRARRAKKIGRDSTSNSQNYSRSSLANRDSQTKRPQTSDLVRQVTSTAVQVPTSLVLPRPHIKISQEIGNKRFKSDLSTQLAKDLKQITHKSRSNSRKRESLSGTGKLGQRLMSGSRISAEGSDHLSRAERLLEKMLSKERNQAQSKQTLESCQSSEPLKDFAPKPSEEPKTRLSKEANNNSLIPPVAFSFSGVELRQSSGMFDQRGLQQGGRSDSSNKPKLSNLGLMNTASTRRTSRRASSGMVIQGTTKSEVPAPALRVPTSPSATSAIGNYTSFFSSRRKSAVSGRTITKVGYIQPDPAPTRPADSPKSPNRIFGQLEELSAIQNLLEEPTEEDFALAPLPIDERAFAGEHKNKMEVDERTSHNLKQLAQIFQKEGFDAGFEIKPLNCERKLNFDMSEFGGAHALDFFKQSPTPVELNLNIAEFNKQKLDQQNWDTSKSKLSVLSQTSQTPSSQARMDQANRRLCQAKQSSQGRLATPGSRCSSKHVSSPRQSEKEPCLNRDGQEALPPRQGTSDSVPFCLPPNRQVWDSCKKPFTDFLAQEQTSLLKLSKSFDADSVAGGARDTANQARFSRRTHGTVEEFSNGYAPAQAAWKAENAPKRHSPSQFISTTLEQASNPFRVLAAPANNR